jgi:hypothetical protein
MMCCKFEVNWTKLWEAAHYTKELRSKWSFTMLKSCDLCHCSIKRSKRKWCLLDNLLLSTKHSFMIKAQLCSKENFWSRIKVWLYCKLWQNTCDYNALYCVTVRVEWDLFVIHELLLQVNLPTVPFHRNPTCTT